MIRIALTFLLLIAGAPALAQTSLSFSSPAGEYVGGGQTKTFSPANSTIQVEASRSAIHMNASAGGTSWDLELTAPVGKEFKPGQYFYAERPAALTGRSPGLSFYGDARGCNLVFGKFTIRQIKFSSTGKLTRFEATAVQYCDDNPKPLAVEARYGAGPYMFGWDSAAGDYVGGGLKPSFYNDTSVFYLNYNYQNLGKVTFHGSGQRHWWDVDIAAPQGRTQFSKGLFYTRRFAEGVYGQLAVGIDSRGCNVSSGTVNVLEVVYGAGGVIDKFYADFTQYCESTTRSGPPLKGRIRYVRGI
jgi:hypothetical protein